MSWPNSINSARTMARVPSTFPVPRPANDNWRMVRTNVGLPQLPANDNFVRRPPAVISSTVVRGLPVRLFLRAVPIIGTGLLAYDAARFVAWSLEWLRNEYVPGFSGLTVGSLGTCPGPSGPIMTAAQGACTLAAVVPLPTNRVELTSCNAIVGCSAERSFFYDTGRDGILRYVQGARVVFRSPPGTPAAQRWVDVRPVYQPRLRPGLHPGRAVPAPAPWLLPPLAPPLRAPSRVKPGYADGRSVALMPEDDAATYGTRRPAPQTDWLRSEPPPRGTHERKFRAPKALERLIGLATESLDWAYVLFNSLPMWRKFQILNAHRKLETYTSSTGRVTMARLRYVALRPDVMLSYFMKHRLEVDDRVLAENIAIMMASDAAWGTIGSRMGRYARGPWDDPFFLDEPSVPDWEPYAPDITFDSEHDYGIMDQMFNARLTTRERERILARWNRYALHEPYRG